MITSYWHFFRSNNRLVSFGTLQTFFSSFGQTFFISLFVPYFIQDFDLTKSSFGTLYSLATLGSAFTLPYLGQWIDRISLQNYTLFVSTGLIGATLLAALSWHFLILFGAIYLLRLFGQGLTSHTAQTAMARYFKTFRGKALSITSLGYPIGEGILPLGFTALIGLIGWRLSFATSAMITLLLLIPLSLWMLKTTTTDLNIVSESDDNSALSQIQDQDKESQAIWSRREVISDARFYFMIPAVLLLPFLITGLFLYQIPLAESKGWSAELMATAFTAFAVARIAFSLFSGPLIDRLSASHWFPFYLLPFTAGLCVLYFFTGSWAALLYMFLAGISMGLSINIKSALWAELYGTRNLGTIKSLFSSLMVFSTAISPFLFGWLLDKQVPFMDIVLASIFLTLLGSLLALRIFPLFTCNRVRAAIRTLS